MSVSQPTDDRKVQLVNGHLVCRLHWFMVCSSCNVDLVSRPENQNVIDAIDWIPENEQLKYLCDMNQKESTPPVESTTPVASTALVTASKGSSDPSSSATPVTDLTGPDESTSDPFSSGMLDYKLHRPDPSTWRPWSGIHPRRFQSEHVSPSALFKNRCMPASRPRYRLVNKRVSGQFLIHAVGVCPSPGNRGGCAFTFHTAPSSDTTTPGTISFPLEIKSPTRNEAPSPSSGRATLRAILAALRYRNWREEGFNTLVIAIDSRTIAVGLDNIGKWVRNRWRFVSSKEPIPDRDLWEFLLAELDKSTYDGLLVEFWHVERGYGPTNERAEAAALLNPPDIFFDVVENDSN